MTKPRLTRAETAQLCQRVELAIGASWPVSRILAELGITYLQYRRIRDHLDQAAAS